jgi:hypothetical protein
MRGFVWYKNWFFLLAIGTVLVLGLLAGKWVVINSFGIGVSNELTPLPPAGSTMLDSAGDQSVQINKEPTKDQIRAICEESIEAQAGNQLDAKVYCNCALPVFYNYLKPNEIIQILEGIPCNKVPEAAYLEIQNCIDEKQAP